MAYRRRAKFRARRRTYRRRSLFKARLKPRGVRGFARRVGRAVNKLAEKKYLVTSYDGLAVQAGSDQQVLVDWMSIPAGNGVSSRVGQKIFLRYVLVEGAIFANTVTDLVVKGQLVEGLQNNYMNPALFPATVFDFADSEKFKVLKKRWFRIGSSNDDGKNIIPFSWKFYIGKEYMYDSSSTSIPMGKVLALNFISNDTVIPSPILSCQVKITYTDI